MTATTEDLRAAITEIQSIVSADGARLDVVDETQSAVRFRLDLSDASCADCVLPPASLLDVVQLSMRRRTGDDDLTVRIDDPRDGE
ncbi:hypothetical protein SAMN05892883_1250 [Jatrophihabitans sp. GAS493]|uniref:hypothetical protein n=1 Tax=Jatrophihabitans sp. GAS493 TaxID=1907575 RepID=UPI000BC07254|nr:hypothetical protein [Jatrophihabitans sp. GAS493]SOD71778.1 hypothetical protein SAMN05892883_1250 [Jatrophihabitans sp. GAS493]